MFQPEISKWGRTRGVANTGSSPTRMGSMTVGKSAKLQAEAQRVNMAYSEAVTPSSGWRMRSDIRTCPKAPASCFSCGVTGTTDSGQKE